MLYTAALKGELHVIEELTYSGVDVTGRVDPYGVSMCANTKQCII